MTDPPALTVQQVAGRWHCSTRHVYGLIAAGQLGHIRVGSLIRVRSIDVTEYEARQWHAPVANDRPSGSSPETGITTSGGGKTGSTSGFQRARQIAARQRAS